MLREKAKVIETVDHLDKILTKQVVDELIFAMPLKVFADPRYIAYSAFRRT